ncbi:RHS repeat protein, partial [Exilibacterium tricleocarpae]
MMKNLLTFVLCSLWLQWGNPAVAEEIRDYYAEPGFNPFKEIINQNFNETVDPFSGTLQLHYTDILVPGNGGMDIRVNRVYTSLQTNAYPVRSLAGLGWLMHFGRIVTSNRHTDKLCNQGLWSVSTRDNPSLEQPDGGRELLVLNAIDNDGTLITRSNWKAECDSVNPGMLVTAPDGTRYTMDRYDFYQEEPSWLTTRIEDIHGNWIRIDYEENAAGESYIVAVYRSEEGDSQPVLRYDYDDGAGAYATPRLASIEANGQRWEYEYENIVGYTDPRHQLVRVRRPDGKTWEYSYNNKIDDPDPNDGIVEDGLGSYSLKQVKYPNGARIDYTYQYVQFDKGSAFRTTSIHTKSVSGGGVQSGTTSYEFAPHSVPYTAADGTVLRVDSTTVTAPHAKYVYQHYGKDFIQPTPGTYRFIKPSFVGLLYRKATYELNDTLKEVVVKAWGQRKISDENLFHGGDRSWWIEEETNSPILLGHYISRDSNADIDNVTATQSVDYSDYDAFGNAQTITEFVNLQDVPGKVTAVTYINDRQNWILSLPVSERVTHNGQSSTISREYFPNTNLLKEENKYGVVTKYNYTTAGDLASVEDARRNVTNYSAYKRGIATREERPESVVLTRVVNDTGTLASETDGRGYTKAYTYDDLNRLTGMVYPIHLPVSISYVGNTRRLLRGNYRQIDSFDGLGRLIGTQRTDIGTNETISSTIEYDASGRKVFESYPNSLEGMSYAYDALGRQMRRTYPDGNYVSFDYDDFLMAETNERGKITRYTYRTVGVSSRELFSIRQPDSITTIIRRNIFDQIIQIFQGQQQSNGSVLGFPRDFEYDSRLFLVSKTEPEIGVTTYGRDEVGNLESVSVSGSATTYYEYDGLNRLKKADYPDETDDTLYEYDGNDNLDRLVSGITEWLYIYDANNNLKRETLSINARLARSYTIEYAYDGLDTISSTVYPDGLVVDYAPNALGRATKVGDFATDVLFHPAGQVSAYTLHNGVQVSQTYDRRLFPETIVADSLLNLTYSYDPSGNVSAIIDGIDSAQNVYMNRVNDYDALDRLRDVRGGWGRTTVSYDERGNITEKFNSDSGNSRYIYSNEKLLRLEGHSSSNIFQYDIYGNTTEKLRYIPQGGFLNEVHRDTYLYDDASRLIQSKVAGVVKDYIYDGHNLRSLSRTGEGYDLRYSVYSSAGQLVFEESIVDCTRTSYIRLGSLLIAGSDNVSFPAELDSDGDGITDCLESQLG